MRKFAFLLAFSLLLWTPVGAQGSLNPDPVFNSHFDQHSGWLGADGAYSLPLSSGRTLWLFSDTLTGRPGQVTMIHNSLGLQPRGAPIQFLPEQFFTPPDGHGWFWVYHGLPDPEQDGAWVFLGQFEEVPQGPEGFNFKFVRTWLAHVTIRGSQIKVDDYRRLPSWSDEGSVHFGAAVVPQDQHLYIYGTRDHFLSKDLVLARAPKNRWLTTESWQFWDGSGWVSDSRQAQALGHSVSNELSVHREGDRFILVTQVGNEVQVAEAKEACGPFQESKVVLMICEPDAGVFTYNAKAHPHLRDAQGRWLLSYNRNALPMKKVLDQPSLYRPQFWRWQP